MDIFIPTIEDLRDDLVPLDTLIDFIEKGVYQDKPISQLIDDLKVRFG